MKDITIIKYIGVFMITFGLSIIVLSNMPEPTIVAQDIDPYEKMTEESVKNLEDFNEYMSQAEQMSENCLIEPEDTTGENILNTSEQTSISFNKCSLEKRENLKKIKNSKYFEQTLKTYQMINESFQTINEILEKQVIDNQKDSIKNRKSY